LIFDYSAKWFGMEFRAFWEWVLSFLSFTKSFYLLRNGSVRNYEVPSVFLFRAFSIWQKRRNSDEMNQNFRISAEKFFLQKWQPYPPPSFKQSCNYSSKTNWVEANGATGRITLSSPLPFLHLALANISSRSLDLCL
jgi:hypothetical protein